MTTKKSEKKIEKQADKLVEDTVGKLVKMVEDQLTQKRKEIAQIEEKQREEFLAKIKREEELQAQLKKERAIAEGMIVEYSELEKKIEEKAAQNVEASSMKEEDVKEGRISVTEFFKSGKSKKERVELSIAQAQKELKETLSVIRRKRTEILNIERELYECQNRIWQMAAFPLRNLEKAFTSMADFIDFQMGPIVEEISEAKSKLDQLEPQFHLIERGEGLTSGHIWQDLTFDEARRVEFDPVLPERHIKTLKARLKELEGEEDIPITIEWFWKGDEFYVDKSLQFRHHEDRTSMEAREGKGEKK